MSDIERQRRRDPIDPADRRALARHAGLSEDAHWWSIAVALGEQLEEARGELEANGASVMMVADDFRTCECANCTELRQAQYGDPEPRVLVDERETWARIAVAAGLDPGTPASEIEQVVRDLARWRDDTAEALQRELDAANDELNEREFDAMGLRAPPRRWALDDRSLVWAFTGTSLLWAAIGGVVGHAATVAGWWS